MPEIIFTPTDFVASINQILEQAFPIVALEGELSQFRISRNRWVYLTLKDEFAGVSCFGSVYQLPGPLEDGLAVRVLGTPRLHPQFGFSLNIQSIQPVGEGSLKKAADLLRVKLEAEGLFRLERKRLLPVIPQRIGLITAEGSAAQKDFWKILNDRWAGVEVSLVDVLVQGEQAPAQIVAAIDYFSELADIPEVLVITRGGGSADDLAAFNDERVVRAVAGSRAPTLVAIGHEVDISLAELAADKRASTPTNAAHELVPDKKHLLELLVAERKTLGKLLLGIKSQADLRLDEARTLLQKLIRDIFDIRQEHLVSSARVLEILSPQAALNRGYAMLCSQGLVIASVKQAKVGKMLSAQLRDGTINSMIKEVKKANAAS